MGFSNEWETIYQSGSHNSVWPWSSLISLVNHYCKDEREYKVLELGCGAGANIPFFLEKGWEYYGCEGSITQVEKLERTFGDKTKIVCCDFTKEIPFRLQFDIIVDRASVTHNSTCDIQHTLDLSYHLLKPGGFYFGVDWFSDKNAEYSEQKSGYEIVDDNTRVFSEGYYKGLGKVHFSSQEHLGLLFSKYTIVEMFEVTKEWIIPEKNNIVRWEIVATKNEVS